MTESENKEVEKIIRTVEGVRHRYESGNFTKSDKAINEQEQARQTKLEFEKLIAENAVNDENSGGYHT